MSNLLLPGQPGFTEILHTSIPPNLRGNNETNNRTAVVGHNGLLRAIFTQKELDEYLRGGEYEAVLSQYDDDDDLDPFELSL